MNKHGWVVAVAVGLLTIGGCGRAKQLIEKVSGKTEVAGDAAEAKGSVGAEPELVAGDAAGPAGMKWERVDEAGVGSVEVPSGEGWTKESGRALQVHHEQLDITVMVQSQGGIPADARSEYLSSLIDVNKRDAPKYEVTSKAEGGVSRQVAGRVDGKFDNGTAYVTRDYALFVKDSVLMLMVRGPTAKAAEVQGIADRMAKSVR